MKAVVEAVPSQEDKVKEAMSVYSNIFVNDSVVLAGYVKENLSQFGLNNRDPEHLKEGMKLLGLEVLREDDIL